MSSREEQELRKQIEEKMGRKGSYSIKESRVDPVDPEKVCGEVKEIFDEYLRVTGRPSLSTTMRVLGNIPLLLKGKWLCMKVEREMGTVPKRLKDIISMVISKEKGCKS